MLKLTLYKFMKNRKDKIEIISTNRKAYFDYEIIETFEAGIVLLGPEVKSLRLKQVNINSGFALVENDEIWIYAIQILPYKFNTGKEIDPFRKRKLLLNKQEIKKIKNYTEQKGLTIIPIEMYFKNGWAKLKIGIAKGKKKFNKKEKLREKDIQRDTEREMKRKNY